MTSNEKLIADAKRLANLSGTENFRAYLREQASTYADHADAAVVEGAVIGHMRHDLDALARELEVVTGQLAVAHAKLYDMEAQLNA